MLKLTLAHFPSVSQALLKHQVLCSLLTGSWATGSPTKSQSEGCDVTFSKNKHMQWPFSNSVQDLGRGTEHKHSHKITVTSHCSMTIACLIMESLETSSRRDQMEMWDVDGSRMNPQETE